ncbi:MAG: hypothetical protein NTW94_01250 [Legionellales bacterium]|nr:hypothetical protein [Legionellales bacterium]
MPIELQNIFLNKIFEELDVVPKVSLDPQTIEFLMKLPKILHTPQEGTNFGRSIKAMKNAEIPLTYLLAKDNLLKLVHLTAKQRSVVADILKTLADNPPQSGKILNEETFDHVLQESKKITENPSDLPKMMRYMKVLGLTLKGRGVSLRALTSEKRIALNGVLYDLVLAEVKLDEKSFDHLLSHITADNKVHGSELAGCIKALQKTGMVLSPLLHRANKLEALLKLSAVQLSQITSILEILSHFSISSIAHLDPIIFEATSFAEKANALVICLNAMLNSNINLSRDLDLLSCQTLSIFQTMTKASIDEIAPILQTLSQVNALNDGHLMNGLFTDIIEHAHDFEGKSKAIVPVINEIHKMKPLETKMDSKTSQNRLKALFAISKDELIGIKAIVCCLLSHRILDEDTYDFIIKNAQSLSRNAADIVAAFNAIPEDIPLQGLQIVLMSADLESIKKIVSSPEITHEAAIHPQNATIAP